MSWITGFVRKIKWDRTIATFFASAHRNNTREFRSAMENRLHISREKIEGRIANALYH